MKIQFESRVVVIGVLTVISVVAIVALAQTPTPTCTPNLTEELPFHLVMRCIQEKDFPQLRGAIQGLPKTHKRIQIDNQPPDGCLPIPAPEPCLGGSKPTSNVTQRVAFADKTGLDNFISAAGL